MAKRDKQTKHGNETLAKKTVQRPCGTDNLIPVWMFDRIDRNGPFAFDIHREDFQHCEFLDKMISYSSMTWSQIKMQTHDNGKSKHHTLEYDSLSKAAQDRIKALCLYDDTDRIFSFALQNKLRIVGLRGEDSTFHVLWYDPNHEICPSHKKGT